ncbi:MAG: pyridoxamine 5'-phosphate oxidase family protein [Pseudomonadales bacterium]
MTQSPFHIGEQHVQDRVGVRESIEPWARKVIRPFLPDQHRDFYAQLPFVVAAVRDEDDRPWATLLVGPPGFLQSPEARSLRIDARPLPGDALEGSLTAGAEIGLLGIQLETRRRNRVNGRITETGRAGLSFRVDQAFGNCPQYITERQWHHVQVDRTASSAYRRSDLSQHQRAWIESADTMFIASGYRGDAARSGASGMDASHRGGQPGFVRVLGDRRLVFPDYAGNNHFNTIGNLVMDPRIGLLFVDFQRGSLLQISGIASIEWGLPEVAKHPGAQRLIYVDIEAVVQLDAVLPLRWSGPGEKTRSLTLRRRIRESVDVTSFEFAASDGGSLPRFEPGQHLPIELPVDGVPTPIKRTYTLSNDPAEGCYRISVKRLTDGLASRLLHDRLREGDVIGSTPPAGDFVLSCNGRPTVLISAGVGITPMVSMLHGRCPDQSVIFVHGARDGAHHPFAAEVGRVAAEDSMVTTHTAYSRPREEDVLGRDFDTVGRLSGDVVAGLLPTLDADFYLCGSPGFMSDIMAGLIHLGANPVQIHTESFGPAG